MTAKHLDDMMFYRGLSAEARARAETMNHTPRQSTVRKSRTNSISNKARGMSHGGSPSTSDLHMHPSSQRPSLGSSNGDHARDDRSSPITARVSAPRVPDTLTPSPIVVEKRAAAVHRKRNDSSVELSEDNSIEVEETKSRSGSVHFSNDKIVTDDLEDI